MLKFQEVVRPEIAAYATPFRVFEDERRTVLYYLVHLTNNDLGMREMKKAMVKKSGEMTFWPVTVRPPDQLELEVAEAKPYPTLQARLREKYAGRTLTCLELLNDDYPDGVWLEPEYRAALVAMEASEPRQVSVVRNRVTDSRKPATRGIQWPDAPISIQVRVARVKDDEPGAAAPRRRHASAAPVSENVPVAATANALPRGYALAAGVRRSAPTS
jgi:hypothetical protein